MNTTRIKKTFVCKYVNDYILSTDLAITHSPQPGDVALFEVIELGKHTTVQSDSRRNVAIVEGDIIMAAYGNRYATGQFEGYIPDAPTVMNDVLAIGGVVGILKSKNSEFEHIPATKVRLIGYAVDKKGAVINTCYYHTPKLSFSGVVPNKAKVILSVGSSMDSGKTTSAAYLCRGLKLAGNKVAYIKLTGTVYTKDQDLAFDLGADKTVDFADAGFPSTYMCSKQEILDLYQTLLNMLDSAAPDYIVIEIADGLVQRETEFLLNDSGFMGTVYGVMLSCSDSLAAFWGFDYLEKIGFTPMVLTGRFTMSPLLINEVQERIKIPVLDIKHLSNKAYFKYFNRTNQPV